MFVLRQSTVREVLKSCSNTIFRMPLKLKNYNWKTFPQDFHVNVCRKCSSKCLNELIHSKHSDELFDIPEEMSDTLDDNTKEGKQTTEEMFAEIANGDAQVLRKLKLMQFEVQVLKQTDGHVPENIRKDEWVELLNLRSMNSKKKYLVFLYKNERKTFNQKQKKKLLREEFLRQQQGEESSDPLSYNLTNQSLLMRIYNKTFSAILPLRNELSEEIAQHVVFDCSYQEYMSPLNTKNCALQLLFSLRLSLLHHYPCYIRFCNLNRTDNLGLVLPKYITNIYNENFPWDVSSESYSDFYPHEKLVYLTPHCKEPLLKPNPGDVYIIGAFVDKGIGVKASLARAKKHKLRMARFPIDEYIKWRQGSKSLPLNTVLKTLLDMKYYNDWTVAFKNISVRHYELDDLRSCTDKLIV